MKKKQKFYFLHIPKTAGTSVRVWLQSLDHFNVCPDGLWSILLKRRRRSLDKYTLFVGHFYTYLGDYIGETLVPFTFLRHPVQRSVSHYLHILRDSRHYLHKHTARMGGFGEFMRDPHTRPMIENFQTRALSMQCDVLGLSKKKPWFSAGRYFIERHIESEMGGYTSATHLPQAMHYLDTCCCAGVTERMEDSMQKLKAALGVKVGGDSFPRLNIARNKPLSFKLTDEEYNMLMGLVADDMALYEYANSLLDTPVDDNVLRPEL